MPYPPFADVFDERVLHYEPPLLEEVHQGREGTVHRRQEIGHAAHLRWKSEQINT